MNNSDITTTWLEMLRPASPPECPALPEGWTILEAVTVPLHFYRYLYQTVGGPWIWGERDNFSDAQLIDVLHQPGYHLFIPYKDGSPAGVIELDTRKLPDVELKYFGLMPEWCGKGVGPKMLQWAIAKAWELNAQRFWLHTCTDDHPGALTVYKRGGFTPYKSKTEPRPYG